MGKENEFYVRMDLRIKAENGGQVVGIVNNFLNNSGIGVELLVMAMDLQTTSMPGQLKERSPNNPSAIISQQETHTVFEKILEATRSNSGFIVNMDTAVKLVRSLPGLTKENLYYWERKGYIHPETVQRGAKKGRLFPTQEAAKVAYMWKFLQEGLGLPAAAKMAEQELLKIKEGNPR